MTETTTQEQAAEVLRQVRLECDVDGLEPVLADFDGEPMLRYNGDGAVVEIVTINHVEFGRYFIAGAMHADNTEACEPFTFPADADPFNIARIFEGMCYEFGDYRE